MNQENSQQGHFSVIDEQECHELLRLNRIGRVGYARQGRITILPVAYVMHEGEVVFKTASGSALAALEPGDEVAFQIDEFDEETRTGWSVLVNGAARHRREGLDVEVRPWALGERELVMAIRPAVISGRAVSAAS